MWTNHKTANLVLFNALQVAHYLARLGVYEMKTRVPQRSQIIIMSNCTFVWLNCT